MSDSRDLKDLFNLNKKCSIVTGGAGYIGNAISETLAELGSDIIILGQDKEKGNKIASNISSKYNIDASFEKINLNSKLEINEFFKNISYDIDILINNHFTWPSIFKLESTEWENFEDTIQTGLVSPFYLSKKVIEKMSQTGGGKIINISSMYGLVAPNFKIYKEDSSVGRDVAYTAAKAGLIQMTKYLASYCAKWKILVNCISPGPFSKPGSFDEKEWFEKEIREMNPLQEIGKPWQIKGAIALLSTEAGSFMTGQNISIDGGWTIW